MNYVSKQVAIALKELGYSPGDNFFPVYSPNSEPIFVNADMVDDCYIDELIPAPDFLTAADWLSEKSNTSIQVVFSVGSSLVWRSYGRKYFYQADHRNASIAYAIQQIKKLKSNESN